MSERRSLGDEQLRQVAVSLSGLPSEEGIGRLDDLTETYPEDAKLFFLRGSLHADIKQYDAALQDFGRSTSLDPGFAIARFQYGLLLLFSGDDGKAREVWALLDRLDEDDCLSLFKRGLCALADGRRDEGFALLKAGQHSNLAFPPLNADMQLILDRAVQGDGLQAAFPDTRETHVLLKGYVRTDKQ